MTSKLRKSRIQSWFQFKGFQSLYNRKPMSEDVSRIYTVEDSTGKVAKATSNEFWVAEALRQVGLDFQFQLSIAGGRGVAFGVVLDFLVLTTPNPTPVWVHGEHWHMGTKRMDDLRAMDTVSNYMRGQVNPGVEIWGSESSNLELASQAVRRKIM